MGQNKIKRIKGGAKGEKWRKGHSCISNPTVKKFRDAANQGFMQKINNINLTEDALVQHVTALGDVSGSAAASFKSLALSGNASFACPSVMSKSQISIACNPPAQPELARPVFDLEKEMDQMSVDENEDLRSQAKTFASRFTTCSIPAFENFFDSMKLDSEHQVMMLSYHSAVQKMIKDKQVPESSLSYFLCIITSLEGFLDNPQSLAAGLALLVRVVKSVPIRNLRLKCKEFGTMLDNILKKYTDSDNLQLVTHVLGCMSLLLRAQPLASWYQDNQLKTWFKNVLVFTLHKESKIRKSGQYNVSAVLKGSYFMTTSPHKNLTDNDVLAAAKTDDEDKEQENEMETEDVVKKCTKNKSNKKYVDIHPATDLVSDFLIGQLKISSGLSAANKQVLHMLVFTRQIIMALPKHKLQDVIKKLFALVSLGNGLVNTSVMHALEVLCTSTPSDSVLPVNLLNSLLTTLTKHTPGMSSAIMAAPHDTVAVKSWSSLVQAAVSFAIKKDLAVGIEWCIQWTKVAQQYWSSNKNFVLSTIEGVTSLMLGNLYDVLTTENCDEHRDGIRKIMINLEETLSFQYQGAWPCIFRLIGQCQSELGLYYAPVMMPSLTILCEMMSNNNFGFEVDLEKAIGKSIQGIGVEAVVSCAPLKITGDITTDERNLWILPILKRYVKASRLLYFYEEFAPLAKSCNDILKTLKQSANPDQRQIKTYTTIEYQIWAMLPSFAEGAVDIEQAQSNRAFSKLINTLIEKKDDSRIDVMRALRHMIDADGSKTSKLAKNAPNYLSQLFNVYCKDDKTKLSEESDNCVENSHRRAALVTIVKYLEITPEETCVNLMKVLLAKYHEKKERSVKMDKNKKHNETSDMDEGKNVIHKPTKDDEREKNNLMTLARCFIPYISSGYINELYQIVAPLIKPKNNKLTAREKQVQKSAYRVLEHILTTETESATQFVSEQLIPLTELFVESVSKAALSSRAPRLRCAKMVLEKLTENTDEIKCEEFLMKAVSESVVCTGRTNSRACRTAAISILSALPLAMKKIKNTDDDTTVRECMRLLSGGLLANSPALQANTVNAITAYTYLAKEVMPLDILQQNVGNMCILMKCPTREVVQACLSYIKGVVSSYTTPILNTFVKIIVDGIIGLTQDCMRKFRLKTKSILTRLMRKFGDDYICKLVPTHNIILHKKLRNLRKEANRFRRQKEQEEEENEERANQRNSIDDLSSEKIPTTLEEILAEIDPDIAGADCDSDDDTKEREKKMRRKNKAADAWIAEDEDSDDDILDFLGPNAANAIMSKKPKEKRNKPEEEGERKRDGRKEKDGGFATDPVSGKLLILEEDEKKTSGNYEVEEDDLEDAFNLRIQGMTGKVANQKRTRDADGEDISDQPCTKKRNFKTQFDYGKEFRSKKAHGDVMKKGDKLKPFSYVPLSKERLNKRKQAKYKNQFKMVVNGTKKGSAIGSKVRKTGRRTKYLKEKDYATSG